MWYLGGKNELKQTVFKGQHKFKPFYIVKTVSAIITYLIVCI